MPCLARALATMALVAVALPTQAQSDYPNKPITLVIALPPGGSNDIMARAVADKMGMALGQQIVVENRASAGSGRRIGKQVSPLRRARRPGQVRLVVGQHVLDRAKVGRQGRNGILLKPSGIGFSYHLKELLGSLLGRSTKRRIDIRSHVAGLCVRERT